MNPTIEIAVIGGGLVGSIAAQCFAHRGQQVTQFFPSNTDRSTIDYPLSLRPSSRDTLEKLGLWSDDYLITAMRQLHLSSEGCFGMVNIARDDNQPAAYVVSARRLMEHIQHVIQREKRVAQVNTSINRVDDAQQDIKIHTTDRHWGCQRLVICDGTRSPISNQLQIPCTKHPSVAESIVCKVTTSHWSAGSGYVRKSRDQILGCIPMSANSGWIIVTQLAGQFDAELSSERQLVSLFNRCLSSRIGQVVDCEIVSNQKSILQSRAVASHEKMILLGNASLSTPPVGAQGLNIAIQDCAAIHKLQQHFPWHRSTSKAWGAQFSADCQPRHDRWFRQMERLLAHLRGYGTYSRVFERTAWALLGVSQRAQHQLEALGLGYG